MFDWLVGSGPVNTTEAPRRKQDFTKCVINSTKHRSSKKEELLKEGVYPVIPLQPLDSSYCFSSHQDYDHVLYSVATQSKGMRSSFCRDLEGHSTPPARPLGFRRQRSHCILSAT